MLHFFFFATKALCTYQFYENIIRLLLYKYHLPKRFGKHNIFQKSKLKWTTIIKILVASRHQPPSTNSAANHLHPSPETTSLISRHHVFSILHLQCRLRLKLKPRITNFTLSRQPTLYHSVNFFRRCSTGNHHHHHYHEYPQPTSPNFNRHQFICQSRSAINHHNIIQSPGATNKKHPTPPLTLQSNQNWFSTTSEKQDAATAAKSFHHPKIKNFATSVSRS